MRNTTSTVRDRVRLRIDTQYATGQTVYTMLLAVSIGHLFNDLIQALVPAMYPLLKSNYGLTFTQVGLITFCFQMSSSVFQPLVGHFTDKRPVPFAQVYGMLFSMLGVVLLAYAPGYGWILLAVTLIGIGSSIFHPESSRISYLASGGKRSLAQGIFQIGGNTGTALGPLLVAWFILPSGQRFLLWFLLIGVLAHGTYVFIGRWYQRALANKHRAANDRIATLPDLSPGQINRSILILLVLIFSKYFYIASISSYFQFYTIDRFGVSEVQAQIYLFYFLIATAVGTLVGGALGDRFGRKVVIWFSVLGAAPFTLALPHADLFWTGVLIVVVGFILSSAFPSILVYAQELLPRKIGVVSGLFYGFAFGMGGLGSALLGWWADHTSVAYIYQVCAFLPLLGLIAYFLPDMRKVGMRPGLPVAILLGVSALVFFACQSGGTLPSVVTAPSAPDTGLLRAVFQQHREPAIAHRRFNHADLDTLLKAHRDSRQIQISTMGHSAEGRALYRLQFGAGTRKMLLWSQMHGDEPTATMALLDLLNFFAGEDDGFDSLRNYLHERVQIHLVPMLNPDGAERYERRNAYGIDLNRDARSLTSPEARLLSQLADSLNPDFAFNLHDQHAYYNVPDTSTPVAMALLAPAYNRAGDINDVRGRAMKLVIGIYRLLQDFVPGAVARYDGTHSPRGFGDTFQSRGISTVLIEAGAVNGDTEKQILRELMFISLLQAFIDIAEDSYEKQLIHEYEQIPVSDAKLFDLLLRRVRIQIGDTSYYETDLGINLLEYPLDSGYAVRSQIMDIGDLRDHFGYRETTISGLEWRPKTPGAQWPQVGREAHFLLVRGDTIYYDIANGSLIPVHVKP